MPELLQTLRERGPPWLSTGPAPSRRAFGEPPLSSTDSGRNSDLRCRVSEALIASVDHEHPLYLPQPRAEARVSEAGPKPIAVSRVLAAGRVLARPRSPEYGDAR